MIDFLVKYSPLIGLLFFFALFCFIAFTLFRPKSKKKFQDYANIPFKEKEEDDAKK